MPSTIRYGGGGTANLPRLTSTSVVSASTPNFSTLARQKQTLRTTGITLEEALLAHRLGHNGIDQHVGPLPSEDYVRRVSTASSLQTGTRKLSKTRRRSGGNQTTQGPSYQRPLTGMSPPGTSQRNHRLDGGSSTNTYHTGNNIIEEEQQTIDLVEIVKLLTDKCNTLALKLSEVEGELTTAKLQIGATNININNNNVDIEPDRAGSRPVSTHVAGQSASRGSMLMRRGGALDDGFDNLRGDLEELTEVFSDAAQMVLIRSKAATSITSLVRMFMLKRRYQRAKLALKKWRAQHSVVALQCIRVEVLRQRSLQNSLSTFHIRRGTKLVRHFFYMWQDIYKRGCQTREKAGELLGRVTSRTDKVLCRAWFTAWWEGALGPNSRKVLVARNMERMAQARDRLHAKLAQHGEGMGVLQVNEVREEMAKEAITTMQSTIEKNLKIGGFARLKELVHISRQKTQKAIEHRNVLILRRIMLCWLQWSLTHTEGLQRNQLEPYREALNLRYNSKRVENFARLRCLRLMFKCWSVTSKRLGGASRLRRKHMTKLARAHFQEWGVEAVRSRKIKQLMLSTWVDSSLKELGVPFRMWYVYAARQKNLRAEQERLVALFRRVRARRMAWRVLRSWSHLTVYGRIDGLYTRPQLVSSLAEEKEHCMALGRQNNALAASLQEMEAMALDYRRQAVARAREVRQSEAASMKVTMALHHAEQDVIRMQNLLDAAAKVSPHVVGAVLKVAPGFDFQERGLTKWARMREETMKKEEEERFNVKCKEFEDQLAAKLADNLESSNIPTHGLIEGQTADAATQVIPGDLCYDSTTTGQAALAAAAIVAGVPPPLLPHELALLDRAVWVLDKTQPDVTMQALQDRLKTLEAANLERQEARDEALLADLSQAATQREEFELQFGQDDEPPEVTAKRLEADRLWALAEAEGKAARELMALAEENAANVQASVAELLRLVGLHDFVRTGEMSSLPAELQSDWDVRPDGGLALRRPRTAKPWSSLSRQARPASGPFTWHDLRMALTAKGMKSRGGGGEAGSASNAETLTESGLQRRLLSGHAETEKRAELMYGSGYEGSHTTNPEDVNIYRPHTGEYKSNGGRNISENAENGSANGEKMWNLKDRPVWLAGEIQLGNPDEGSQTVSTNDVSI